MFYIISLVILVTLYVLMLCLQRKFKHTKLVNAIYCVSIFVLYVIAVINVYKRDGAQDWNFKNTLPYANVSPFMFCSMPLYFVLPKKVRKYYLTLISLLCVGMFLSPVFNLLRNAYIHYKFHFHFLLDYIAHFMLSLWGLYLVSSKQVELKKRDVLIGGSIIVMVVIIMLVLNIIFDTAFFGLSLNGKHNIYNVVLVNDSYLSALIYFAGLITVLITSFLLQYVLNKNNK